MQAVFALILVGELLAFALVLVDHGFPRFKWLHFGAVSFLTQWIILASAACLCPLRPWFRRQNGLVAGTVSYSIVLSMTALFTLLGQWFGGDTLPQNRMILAENLVIAAVFAGVVLRYFYLQQQLHNREQAELQSRIQALQSRIRPHFLFNSMNSIASLIETDPKAAEKMVVDLAQLFRASLSEAVVVPLEDEITLCKQFVSIEKTRLGQRLTVDWTIDLHDSRPDIPSLLLQPLLENAIYHGIQPLAEGGVVTVDVAAKGGEVALCVRNPVAALSTAARRQSNGIALENIRRRLQAHFGERAFMRCRRENNEFIVAIRYPVTDQKQGS